jgi:hypothetical protein
MSVLEEVSYTSKDGQFLRWDQRAIRPHSKHEGEFRKKLIRKFKGSVIDKLEEMAEDIVLLNNPQMIPIFEPAPVPGSISLAPGSCLDILPAMPNDTADLILTSPPYCNRYDYTRTYALELAYLGLDNQRVRSLRQNMLTATVENMSKLSRLQTVYRVVGRSSEFFRINDEWKLPSHGIVPLVDHLVEMSLNDQLNNTSVPDMVEGYFTEMAFVIAELFRVTMPGGVVVMVNDNVQYGGVEIPVDFMLSSLAEAFGFTTDVIWVLPKGKGNASQQMAEHGRREQRKCVYVWRKPS